jgi:hypothetical protein
VRTIGGPASPALRGGETRGIVNAVRRFLAAIVALGRTWRGRFIAAFLLLQLLLPLHYYVARKDKHDERFAWRMFSPMRAVSCMDPADVDKPARERNPPRFTVDDQPVVLEAEFHEAWVKMARRGRYAVLEKMGAALCAGNRGKAVRMTMACTYLDGTVERVGGFDLCRVPEL